MTIGIWKCQTCNHKMMSPISQFHEKCPKCGEKYKYLAEVIGMHIAHTFPVYCRQKDWPKKVHITQISPMAFVTSGNKFVVFACKDAKIAKFLKEELKNNPHLIIKLLKKGESDFKLTMREAYGMPNDKMGKHQVCMRCGFCVTCGDCERTGCGMKKIKNKYGKLGASIRKMIKKDVKAKHEIPPMQ